MDKTKQIDDGQHDPTSNRQPVELSGSVEQVKIETNGLSISIGSVQIPANDLADIGASLFDHINKNKPTTKGNQYVG